MKQKKSPGLNGITNEVVKLIFKTIPKTIPLFTTNASEKGATQPNVK